MVQGGANELWQPGSEKIARQPLSPVLAQPPIWSMVYWVPQRVLSVEKKISGSNSSHSLGNLVQVFEQCGYLLVQFHYVYIKLLLRLAVGTTV